MLFRAIKMILRRQRNDWQAIFYSCSIVSAFSSNHCFWWLASLLPTAYRIIILGLIGSFMHISYICSFISEPIFPLVESGDVNSISCFVQQEQDGGDVTCAFLSSWSEYAGWILVELIMRSIKSFFALRNHYGSRRYLLRG